jgi:hypothetical protein
VKDESWGVDDWFLVEVSDLDLRISVGWKDDICDAGWSMKSAPFTNNYPKETGRRAWLRGDRIMNTEDSQIKPSNCRLLRELYVSCAPSEEKTLKT